MNRNPPMDDESDQLERLALAVQKQPRGSNGRRLAQNRLVCAIERSGKLFCQGRFNFPPEVYDEAVRETLLYLCRNIDRYNPTIAKVMTWVNDALHFRFIDAIARYRKQQERLKREVSLDCPVNSSNNRNYNRTPLEMLAQPETISWPSERVRDCIEKDPDGLFARRCVRGHPQANFRAIALLYLERKSWKDIAVAVGISAEKWSTVQSHFWRSCRYFAPKFQEYLQQGDDEE